VFFLKYEIYLNRKSFVRGCGLDRNVYIDLQHC
jgi:hypothetical protein